MTQKTDLPARLRKASESLHLPPSIQNQRNIAVMNACDEAAVFIEQMLTPVGKQQPLAHWGAPETEEILDEERILDPRFSVT